MRRSMFCGVGSGIVLCVVNTAWENVLGCPGIHASGLRPTAECDGRVSVPRHGLACSWACRCNRAQAHATLRLRAENFRDEHCLRSRKQRLDIAAHGRIHGLCWFNVDELMSVHCDGVTEPFWSERLPLQCSHTVKKLSIPN